MVPFSHRPAPIEPTTGNNAFPILERTNFLAKIRCFAIRTARLAAIALAIPWKAPEVLLRFDAEPSSLG